MSPDVVAAISALEAMLRDGPSGDPLSHPSKMLRLDDIKVLIQYDDFQRDEWSRDLAQETDRREAAREFISHFDLIDEAIAYARGNGGPSHLNDKTEQPAGTNPTQTQSKGKRGGSLAKYDATSDATLVGDYRTSSLSIKEFARLRGISFTAVKAAIDRHRKRRK